MAVAGWLRLAKIAESTVSVAAAVHQEATGEPDGWEHLWTTLRTYSYSTGDPGFYRKPPFSPAEGRKLVDSAVGRWLNLSGVRPIFLWDEVGPRVQFWGGTFAVLGLQLVRAVSLAGAVSICSACGTTYVRAKRRAQAGRRNYCSSCGDRAGNRLRQDTHRSKRRASSGSGEKDE